MKDRTIISFFFNARGEGLEKSTLGTYRSLLLQFLEQFPILESVLTNFDFSAMGSGTNYQWTAESLKTLLERAILSLGESSVVYFLDALDECNERQIRDMISFFEHVSLSNDSGCIRFHICFSSRYYPHITIRKRLQLILEGQEGHTQDMTNYTESELKIGHGKTAKQIRIELQEKAAGIFLWVVLVVEILNKQYDNGRVHALQRKLRDIPSDLYKLFHDILTRDSQNRDDLLLYIQWIFFARRPLGPEELYFAILSGVESPSLSRWDPDEVSTDDMKRFVLDLSKGLVEITKSKNPKVQFIHESVTDFLLRGNGLGKVFVELESNLKGQSHEQLKRCCIDYMKIDVVPILELQNDLPKASSQEATILRDSARGAFPFMEYVVRQILFHANTAQSCDIPQGEFISNFPLNRWIRLINLFERHQVRRYTPNASLMYILAEYNMSNLIGSHRSILLFLDIGDERYGLPLFAALATGSERAVLTFIKVIATNVSLDTHLQRICDQYNHLRGRQSVFGRDFNFKIHRTVLSYLIEFGDEVLFDIVLTTEKCPPDC